MESKKMPDGLFYKPAGLGFAIGLVFSLVYFGIQLYFNYEKQDLLKYKRELFYALADQSDSVRVIPVQTSIIAGNIILEEYRRGVSVDSLFRTVDNLNYAFSAFGGSSTDQNKKKFLISVLTSSGRLPEYLLRLVDDTELNNLLNKPENIETIKMILAKKIPVPEVVYKLPGFPNYYAIYSLLIAQCLGYLFFILRILAHNNSHTTKYRWRHAPWGKPGTWILVIPGCLVWIVIYGIVIGIVILFGNDWLERVKSRRNKTEQPSLKNLTEYSDKDTESLAKKLQENIEGRG